MTDQDTSPEAVERLRKLLSYGLPPHVTVQTGSDTKAPSAVFADADYEVGDGVCGIHASGKQASEPCIPYLRADAVLHAIAHTEAAKAQRDALKAELAKAVDAIDHPLCSKDRETYGFLQHFILINKRVKGLLAYVVLQAATLDICDCTQDERVRVLEAENARLRGMEALQTKARAQHWLRRHIDAPEDAEVEALCKKHGYGAVMDAASRLWARTPHGGGAFYIGGCIGPWSDDEARATLRALEQGTP